MIELLIGLMTAGGSAGFGSILKMIGGAIASSQEAKMLREEKELIREIEKYDQAIEFQKQIMSDNYTKHSRRLIGVIGMLSLSFISIWCCIFPELILTTFSRDSGSFDLLFGAISYPVTAKTTQITLGHIALVTSTVVYPMIVGFYFTPSGRGR